MFSVRFDMLIVRGVCFLFRGARANFHGAGQEARAMRTCSDWFVQRVQFRKLFDVRREHRVRWTSNCRSYPLAKEGEESVSWVLSGESVKGIGKYRVFRLIGGVNSIKNVCTLTFY